MLARAAIKGHGGASHLTATRLDLIGGLTELATDVTTTTPAMMQRATCPFCVAQAEDSLQHLVWDCKSDRHLTAIDKVINAKETVVSHSQTNAAAVPVGNDGGNARHGLPALDPKTTAQRRCRGDSEGRALCSAGFFFPMGEVR